MAWGQFGVSPSGGLVVVQGLQPAGDTVEPRGLDAEPISATPATRPRPPVTAANGKEIRRLKAAFTRGVEWKELDMNPLASVKAPRGVRSVAVKFYDRAAMRSLYRAHPARAPLWMFMAHTGLRRGEVIGLAKSSVVGGRLFVESDPDETGAGRTKSGKWREVPLNRYAKWALRHLPDPLVTAHKDTVSDWFKKDSELAGVGGHPHRLRHTFCAHMVMAGVPLRRVQLLAGHADYATTEKYYAHLTPEGNDAAVAQLRF